MRWADYQITAKQSLIVSFTFQLDSDSPNECVTLKSDITQKLLAIKSSPTKENAPKPGRKKKRKNKKAKKAEEAVISSNEETGTNFLQPQVSSVHVCSSRFECTRH